MRDISNKYFRAPQLKNLSLQDSPFYSLFCKLTVTLLTLAAASFFTFKSLVLRLTDILDSWVFLILAWAFSWINSGCQKGRQSWYGALNSSGLEKFLSMNLLHWSYLYVNSSPLASLDTDLVMITWPLIFFRLSPLSCWPPILWSSTFVPVPYPDSMVWNHTAWCY